MQLVEIAEIERTIQRIDKFRMLVIQGFQAPAEEQHGSDNAPFLCRDAKNNMICISLDDLEQDVSRLEHRSEEHTSELQSLMRISYAVFCLTKKTNCNPRHNIKRTLTTRQHTHAHITQSTATNISISTTN